MTETCINYFTEIEEHFRRARGTPLFRLSSNDWVLIDEWKKGGIPLEAVLRGIDVSFEKWRRQPAQATTQMVNSVAYCAQAVAAEAQAMANAAPVVRREARPPFAIADVRGYIARNAGKLREVGFDDLAESLESLDLSVLYTDLEQLEQRLTTVEEQMIATLRAAATEEALLNARHELDRDLKPYRNKMTADQLAMLEKQLLERRLLETAGLPRLSLFYL